jgi:5-methylcytosine-specific restriction endonuclease McrA
MSRSWQGGSTTAWRKTRALVLDRDGHACQLRLPGCTRRAEHAHHLDGKAMGDDIARLVASCQHCNLSTGQPTGDPSPEPRTRW